MPKPFNIYASVLAILLIAAGTLTAADPTNRNPNDPPQIEITGSHLSLPAGNTPDKPLVPATVKTPPAEQSLPAKRLPVPEHGAREKGLSTVRDVFKTDIDKAKTAGEQIALAEKLMKTAAETKDDPVGRFVLWQLAVETATKAGEATLAFSALEEVARNYEVDELTAKSRTFANLAPRVTTKCRGVATIADAVAPASRRRKSCGP